MESRSVEVQDHHVSRGTPTGRSAHVHRFPAAIAKIRSFRTIQMYGRPTRGRFHCSKRDQESTGREADLGAGWEVY